MPFEISWEGDGVYRRYHGNVTIDDRRRSFDRICADPRFDDLRYAITDYLTVEGYEITPWATEEIAAMHIGAMHTNPRIVIAAVVVDTAIIDAIEHFISLRFISQPYRIFSSVTEARRWIAAEHGAR